MKTVEQVVDGLPADTLKVLAANNIRGLQLQVIDNVANIARTTRSIRLETDPDVRAASENALGMQIRWYESSKRQLTRYGLWDASYDQSFEVAKKTGEFRFFNLPGGAA